MGSSDTRGHLWLTISLALAVSLLGHYVAYRRVGNQWLEASDEQVTEVTWERVGQAEAYMLFYQRRR